MHPDDPHNTGPVVFKLKATRTSKFDQIVQKNPNKNQTNK